MTRLKMFALFCALAGALVVATPVARAQAGTATPEAASCTGAQADIEMLIPLWYGPTGSPIATPEPTSVTSASELPQGQPASAEDTAALDQLMAEFLACSNANDLPRLFALLTPNVAASFGPENGETPDEVRQAFKDAIAGTPVPPDEGETSTGSITRSGDAVSLPDGRLGASFTDENGQQVFVIATKIDDKWLVDELIFLDTSGGQSTPTS